MKQDVLQQIEGYDRILRERAVCRRYGQDFLLGRASVQRILEGLHPPQSGQRHADRDGPLPAGVDGRQGPFGRTDWHRRLQCVVMRAAPRAVACR